MAGAPAEEAAPEPAVPAIIPEPLPGWSSTGRFGLFTSNITTANSDTSRDTEVQSGGRSTSVIGTFDGTLRWRAEGPAELEQRLQARYGRNRTGDQSGWSETSDLVEYEGVYRHRYQPRRALYAANTANSAFVGPDPWNDPFDPIKASISAGHSWLWENPLPLTDRLELRAGVRAQKRWGKGIGDFARQVELGPEAWLRYERKQSADLSWWVQAELFTEYDDPGHAEGLTTAALQLQLTRLISVDLRARAYFERRPRDLPDDAPDTGYNQLGLRQETLIGVNVSW